MKIPRVLVFDAITGDKLLDTGQMDGGSRTKTDEEIHRIYDSIKERAFDSLIFVRLGWDEYKNEFLTGRLTGIDLGTKELIFDFTPQEQEQLEELKTREQLTQEVCELQQTNLTLMNKIAEYTIEKENTNQTVLDLMTEVAILKGGAS